MRDFGLELLLMGLGVSTIVGFGLPPIGPWWFIPFIVQFYAIWPLMQRLAVRFGWKGLIFLAILCRVITYAVNPLIADWGLNLLLTPIGHMSELCLGIAAARFSFQINAPLAIFSCAILILGSEYQALWLFTFLAALLVTLWIYTIVRERLRGTLLLQRLGEYSLLIFLLNGIIRGLFLGGATRPGLVLLRGALSAAVSIFIAALIQESLLPKPKKVEARQLQTT